MTNGYDLFVSVDVETAGPIPGEYSLLAIGACLVDAPEKGRPGYQAAKRRLERLIGNQMVEVDAVAQDAYARTVANVRVDGRSVNAAMLGSGRRQPG